MANNWGDGFQGDRNRGNSYNNNNNSQRNNDSRGRQQGRPQDRQERPVEPFKELTKMNYVDIADKIAKENTKVVSTSKIRGLFSMILEVSAYMQNHKNTDAKLNEDVQSMIKYTKMRFAYEAGREPKVKEFLTQAHLIEHLDNIKDSKEYLTLVCKYMESLVAFHKFYGGREN